MVVGFDEGSLAPTAFQPPYAQAGMAFKAALEL